MNADKRHMNSLHTMNSLNERRVWIKPVLSRLEAGAAEVLASVASDGVSTQS